MRVGVVFVSDRGDRYLPGCVESFDANVPECLIAARHTVDDSAHNLGMAGAVRAGWEWALDQHVDYLLHVEEDFRFSGAVPIAEMTAILDLIPRLAQVVLKRQPWSDEERRAGGIMEMHPGAYEQCCLIRPRALNMMLTGRDEPTETFEFVEHRRIFSLNPCLIPRRVLELGWPDDNEAGFTQTCLAAGYSFAYYGRRSDPPRVCHVGSVRGSGWRL